MIIKIKNIGMIKNAEINLDGLSVIAGENDSGKSTVGKIVFCIIKAISNYESDNQQYKSELTIKYLRELYFHIRKIDENKYAEILKSLAHHILNEVTNAQSMDNNIIQPLYKNSKLSQDEVITDIFNNMNALTEVPDNRKELIEKYLKRLFQSEFDTKLIRHNQETGTIELLEGSLSLIKMEVDINNNISISDNIEPIEMNDATFIETPLILNNYKLLVKSQTSPITPSIPITTFHIKDLFNKLIFGDSDADNNTDAFDIPDIIKGNVVYDEDKKDFLYMRDGNKIPIKNTATGIKSFGIIKILIENDFINKKSLLILDEPEIHLHPKWQLVYAQLISKLVKNDCNILITSHSPYMIEALQRYSEEEKVEDKTNFYLAEDGKTISENSLSKIFELLSEPFETFRDMDRDALRDG